MCEHSLARGGFATCLSQYQRAVEKLEADRLVNLCDLQMSRWPFKSPRGRENKSVYSKREGPREGDREREREREGARG